MDLSSDASSEPWSRTERIFGMLLEIIFDRNNALLEECLGFSLAIFLPVWNWSELEFSRQTVPEPTSCQCRDS